MGSTPPSTARPASRGRVLAFRLIAGIAGVLAAGLSFPFAIATLFGSGPDVIHRLHNLSGGLGFGLLSGVVLLLCAWRPERWIAAFHVAIASSLAVVAAGLLSGDLITAGYLAQAVIVGVLLALHPARDEVLRPRPPNPVVAAVPVLALIPSFAYALTWSRLQRQGVPADPHVELHHYSQMAALGFGLPLVGLAAALGAPGWRAMAWFVGFSWVAFGAASLAWPDFVSAFDPPWAWASIAAGVAIAAAAEWRAARSRRSRPAGRRAG